MLAAAIISAFIVIGTIFSPSQIDRSANSVVKLESRNIYGQVTGSGTGFAALMGKKKVMISNAHVCESNKYMYSQFEGKKYRHRVIKYSKKADLCMLTIPRKMDIKSIKIALEVNVEEEITAIGFPYGEYKIRTKGKFKGPMKVSAPWNLPLHECKDRSYLSIEVVPMGFGMNQRLCIGTFNNMGFTTLMSAPGGSGSPIVNSHGRIVGVVSMIQGGGAPWAIAVPLEDIKDFLKG